MTTTPSAAAVPARSDAWPAPIRMVLDLFSSVRFGVVLLVILFFYCSIGSAGLIYPVGLNIFNGDNWRLEFLRQWRGIELTEFEWFHTWFFNLNIGLICANIIVTTLRRIRLSWLNAGVWMIHTGIIVLSIGSVIYFGRKVEGDAPIVRRSVVLKWNKAGSSAPVVMPALPGNRLEVPAPGGVYVFQIADINPQWPIQSEEHKGQKAYSVSVAVTRPDGERYIRQMLDGFPQYTEDVIPGKGRFKKQAESGGKAIFDEDISMSLAYEPQDRFWIKDSWALYSRKAGTRDWIQRPIHGLPRYNDYVPTPEDVWVSADQPMVPVSPLDVVVPAGDANDPLRDAQVRVTGYLRYAMPREQLATAGGATLYPVVDLTFNNKTAGSQRLMLAALDPERSAAVQGMIGFRWVNDDEGMQRLRGSAERKLTIGIPALNVRHEAVVSPEEIRQQTGEAPWKEIPGTEGKYAYRVKGAADNLAMPAAGAGEDAGTVWILMVEFKTPEKVFSRFVADIDARTRDVSNPTDPAHGMVPPDPSVLTVYQPAMLSPVTVVAGPGEIGLRVLLNTGESPREEVLKAGAEIDVNETLTMKVNDWSPTGRLEARPAIVPVAERNKDADRAFLFSMVKVEITRGGKTVNRWLPFHRYSFADEGHSDMSLSRFDPAPVVFDDGREIELIFSRESMALPTRVALSDFVLTSHVGGFEPGKMGSIRDWTSELRFEDPTQPDGWTPGMRMSTNDPVSHQGMWYFQSFWDPPRSARFQGDAASNGLNFTGVGVGNREGVYTQLAGCCLSVFGMLYAFYYKPILRRRMKQRALDEAAASGRMAGLESRGAGAPAHRNGHMVTQAERASLLNDGEG